MILTDPENPITKFITFFPITSPVVALVHYTVGSRGTLEAVLALVVTSVFMVISIWVAVRAFSLGALEYACSVKLRRLFKE